MRGERCFCSSSETPSIGSSPHARGTRHHTHRSPRPCRFIPACAGNAISELVSRGRKSVHPRMRGERRLAERCSYTPDGSSPHARGTPHPAWRDTHGVRFIPACAGNAPTTPHRSPPAPVHPRMRGERNDDYPTIHSEDGSSPHARGTLLEAGHPLAEGRFIPACAGNAHRAGSADTGQSVHPRMRGEREAAGLLPRDRSGSSPHARGTPGPAACRSERPRFIPACAGNALLPVVPSPLPPVHPRMRGERGVEVCLKDTTPGSSPHARGTPARFAYPA